MGRSTWREGSLFVGVGEVSLFSLTENLHSVFPFSSSVSVPPFVPDLSLVSCVSHASHIQSVHALSALSAMHEVWSELRSVLRCVEGGIVRVGVANVRLAGLWVTVLVGVLSGGVVSVLVASVKLSSDSAKSVRM